MASVFEGAEVWEGFRPAHQACRVADVVAAADLRPIIQPPDRDGQVAEVLAAAHIRVLLQPANRLRLVADVLEAAHLRRSIQPDHRQRGETPFLAEINVGVLFQAIRDHRGLAVILTAPDLQGRTSAPNRGYRVAGLPSATRYRDLGPAAPLDIAG